MRTAITLGGSVIAWVLVGCSSGSTGDGSPSIGGSAAGPASGGASVSLGGMSATMGGAGPAAGNSAGTAATAGGSLGGGGASTEGGASSGGEPGIGGGSSAGAAAGAGAQASGGAAAGGASQNATGGSDGTSAGCNVDPVTPNATAQTRKVLCYLYSQYRNHLLSGQEENGADQEVNYIVSTTGKYPAVRAFDVNNSSNDTRCLSHWNSGGLCMFGYHMGVANNMPDGYQSSETKVSIDTVLTEGSDLNTTFKSRMDKAAAEIQKVQDGNGVVIWRPFHEAGGTWFWWSMEGGAQYVRLWKYMFNYMTATKGLKNLLWLLPYDGSPQASFYPGKQYVDIGGADNYDKAFDYTPMTSIYNAAQSVFGTTMPIALHECGPVIDPDQAQSAKADWVFFSIWTEPYPSTTWNSTDELKKVYSSSYVITRDEMPNLK